MKKVFIIALIIAVAAPALAFKAYYYNGKICKHGKDQIPWTMRFNSRGTPDCVGEFIALGTALNTWSNVTYQWYRNSRGDNTDKVNKGLDGTLIVGSALAHYIYVSG